MPQERYHWWRDRERRRGSSSRSSSRSSSSHSDRGRYRSRSRRSDSRKRSEQRFHRSRSPRTEKDKSDRKSRICMHWQKGTCTKGSDCPFAHGAHELSAVQAGTWKTVLCNHFEKGTCTRGANCSFAHGEEELRDTYKTVLCKYWETGNCKSGSKCNFAHGVKELVKLEVPKIEVKVEKPPEKGTSETAGSAGADQAEKNSGKADKVGFWLKPKAEKVSKVNTKEIPCRYWQNGFCNKGESCPFAHEGPQNEPSQAQNFKTILCKYFAQGHCSRGDSCNFAHGNEELPGGSGAAATDGSQEPQPASAFKTVLCKYFELGNCSKGDECTYAHGIEELQTREAGTYKTVLCKFFEAGSCSRGASCTFAHGEEDLLNDSLGSGPATGSTASAGSCAVAATAFATTSLADAIAKSTASPADGLQTDGPVGVLIQPTRLLSKRQLESTAPVEVPPPKRMLTRSTPTPTPTPAEAPSKSVEVKRCAFFAVGRCAKGEECPYFHDNAEAATSLRSGVATVAQSVKQAQQNQQAQGTQEAAQVEDSGAKAQPKLVLPPPKVPKVIESQVTTQREDGVDPVEVEIEVDEWNEVAPVAGYKSALCKFFEHGSCLHGENCTFAHGVEELQPLYKTAICKFFEQGTCTKGANCTFAHGAEELQAMGTTWQDAGVTAVTPASMPISSAPVLAPPQVYKTAMCKYFEQGTCLNGDNCNYAHSEEELQPLYKTHLCKYFEQGNCTKGASCTFAHGLHELQGQAAQDAAPTNAPGDTDFAGFAAELDPVNDFVPVPPVYKKTLCKFFEQGMCTKGENCPFAHGIHELAQDNTLTDAPIPAAAYKTAMCKFFQKGQCLLGDQCTYAHGVQELQPPKEAPLFKTALCVYYPQGICTKGENCTFAHGVQELQAMQPTSSEMAEPPLAQTSPSPVSPPRHVLPRPRPTSAPALPRACSEASPHWDWKTQPPEVEILSIRRGGTIYANASIKVKEEWGA